MLSHCQAHSNNNGDDTCLCVGSQVVGTQVLIDLCQHCHGHIVIFDLLVAFVENLHMHVTASCSNITCFPA